MEDSSRLHLRAIGASGFVAPAFGKGAAVMSGNSYYSAPFDMGDFRALLVEARLHDETPHLPAHATLRVQGTDDGLSAERKCWVDEGFPLELGSGTRYRGVYHRNRGVVRVVLDPQGPGGRGRVEIRLTRLP